MKDEESLLSAIGYGRITTRHVLAKLVPPDKLERGTRKADGALRIVVSSGLETEARSGHSRQRGRRCAGSLCLLLPSFAGRTYRRFYHARAGRDGSYGRLPDGFGKRSASQNRSPLGGERPAAAAGKNRSHLRRSARLSGGDQLRRSPAPKPISRARRFRTFSSQSAVNTFEVMIKNSEHLKRSAAEYLEG